MSKNREGELDSKIKSLIKATKNQQSCPKETTENIQVHVGKKNKKSPKESIENIQTHVDNEIRKSRRKNPPRRIVVKEVDNHCDLCGEDFSNSNTYLLHLKKCGDNCSLTVSESTSKRRTREDSLSEDGKGTATPVRKCGGKVSCDHCYEKVWHSELKEHIQEVHGISDMYTCCHCSAVFDSRRLYSSHMRYEHDDKKAFKCSFCNNAYELYESLKRHNRIHNKELALTCDECGKSFAEKITLKRHKTIHTGTWLLFHELIVVIQSLS